MAGALAHVPPLIEIAVLLVVGAITTWFASSAVVLAVAFVAALQNATFGTVREWSVNTTMITGNLRTAARATYRAVFRRDEGAAQQARTFGLVVLSFLVGAGVGRSSPNWSGTWRRGVAAGGKLHEKYLVTAVVALLALAPTAHADTTSTATSISGPSPFPAGCDHKDPVGANYPNAEVQPDIAVDPRNPAHMVGAWQTDRWSGVCGHGLVTAATFDGGRTWTQATPAVSTPPRATWSRSSRTTS